MAAASLLPSSTRWNVLTLARSSELKSMILATLAGHREVTVDAQVGELKTMNGALHDRIRKSDMLIVDVDATDPDDLGHLRRLVEERRGHGSVMATARDVSPHAVRELVRQGIDDFIPQPILPQDLLEAVATAGRKLAGAGRDGTGGKLIAVGRGKGGMGATTVAVHLALALLEKRRRRDPAPKVCLLDLDLQFGDAALYLDLSVKAGLMDIIREPERLDEALFTSALTVHKSGLAVLPAPNETVPVEALERETAERLLTLACDAFDYVVVDLPLAIAAWEQAVLTRADKLILVTQLSVPAVRRTRRLLDIFREEGLLRGRPGVLLNRHVRSFWDRGRLRQAVKALDQPIAFYVPNDYPQVLDAANRGIPLFELGRRNRVWRAVRDVGRSLVAELQERPKLATTRNALQAR
jgi:pilus assembly protein CpaE